VGSDVFTDAQIVSASKHETHKQAVDVWYPQTSRPRLWPAKTTKYKLLQLCTKFGKQAFSHTSLAAWNSLLHKLQSTWTIVTYEFQLKNHLLQIPDVMTMYRCDKPVSDDIIPYRWWIQQCVRTTSLPTVNESNSWLWWVTTAKACKCHIALAAVHFTKDTVLWVSDQLSTSLTADCNQSVELETETPFEGDSDYGHVLRLDCILISK